MNDNNQFDRYLTESLNTTVADVDFDPLISTRVISQIRRQQRRRALWLALSGATGASISLSCLWLWLGEMPVIQLHLEVVTLPAIALSPLLLTASAFASMLGLFTVIIQRSFDTA